MKHYIRKKAGKQDCAAKDTTPSTSSGNICTRSQKEKGKLTVKLPLPVKSSDKFRKYQRALRASNRKIEFMTEKLRKLEKLKKTLQKRNERASRRVSSHLSESGVLADQSSCSLSSELSDSEKIQMTPQSKTKLLLRKAGVTFNQKNKVHRELLLGSVVVASIRRKLAKKKKINSSLTMVSAEILKKYRCLYRLSEATGVSRKKVTNINVRRPSAKLRKIHGEAVKDFLEREDNSIIQPGKRDSKTVEKEVHQKHVLNDYMHNLWEKFLLENPSIKLSRSQFCKLRPSHVLLTSFASRRTCLCTYHQNFALKIKAMKKNGIQCTANPDSFLKEFETEESLKVVLEKELETKTEVTYKHWKKVQDVDKYRWKELEECVPKQQFIECVLVELAAFRSHVLRVQNQYREMRKLRENLPENEILLWMDFAENYSCSSVEEVQSAFWNVEMVSLHTMVAYLPSNCDKTKQCLVAASGSLQHNAAAVCCILQKCVPLLKEEVPNLKCIHYLTDSPTSQYRNKTVFQFLCDHQEEFGVSARWHYLECGHGKGPCDGLGASVKRAADMSVKQGKATIQGADDFVRWANTTDKTSKVRYISYNENDVQKIQENISRKDKPVAIAGTLKLHAAVPISKLSIATRELSCNCGQCIADVQTTTCEGWNVHNLYKLAKHVKEPEVSSSREKPANETLVSDSNQIQETQPIVNDWVAALYDNEVYLGQVTDTDTDDVQINFLTEAGKYGSSYRFPNARDEIWVQRKDVLMILKSLMPVGKTKRCFQLDKDEQKEIENKYNQRRVN